MLNTIKGQVIRIVNDTVTANNNQFDVLRINVRTAKRSYKREGGTQISQVNLTVWEKELIEELKAMEVNDFVEVLMGDAIINGNYVNGNAYDVAYIDHEEYAAPVNYRDVSNAPSGRIHSSSNNADEVVD